MWYKPKYVHYQSTKNELLTTQIITQCVAELFYFFQPYIRTYTYAEKHMYTQLTDADT